MDEILELTKIDFASVFLSVFIILIGIKAIISLFEWVIEKLGLETKWMRRKREDHELLIATVNSLKELSKKHDNDVNKVYDDNSHWREQSAGFREKYDKQFNEHSLKLDIMQEQTKQLLDGEKTKEQQINSLTIANRELLAGKINDKYKYFISIGGVPEDEVDEFTALHLAYNGCGGNHHGDAKYNYVMEHLPVIPVETKLVYKED